MQPCAVQLHAAGSRHLAVPQHTAAVRQRFARPRVAVWAQQQVQQTPTASCEQQQAPGSCRSLESVLQEAGIEKDVLCSVKLRNPDLNAVNLEDRAAPLLAFLTGALALQPHDIEVMLLRCPRLFSFSMQRQVLPVVEWLRQDLGFDQQQVASTLRCFPQALGYGVKSHLVPHRHYLKSLGVPEEQLPQLVLSRPYVLGSGIELVITYLRKWLRVPRTHVGRLLWSYPLDFSLPRLVLPDSDAAAMLLLSTLEEEEEEQEEGAEGANHHHQQQQQQQQPEGPHAALAGAQGQDTQGRSSSSGAGAGQASSEQQRQRQQQQRAAAPWGSRERCSWLDVAVELKGGRVTRLGGGDPPSSSSSSSGGSGGGGGDSSPGAGPTRPPPAAV